MDVKILKNIIKGTSVTTFGSIISMGFHFISIFFITRHLSLEAFGIYAIIVAVSGLLNLFSSLGLEIGVVKFISEGSELRHQLLRPTIELKTISTLLVTIIFFFLYKFYPTNGETTVWNYNIFIVLIFVIGSYRDFFYRVLQGVNKFREYTYVQIWGAVSRVILILLFILFYQLSLEYLLIIEVITASLSVIFQIISIPFRELWDTEKSSEHYKYILKFSAPLFANNLITFAYDRIGIFIIGILLTATSVAIFDVASRLPSALQGILSSFLIVFFPNISTLYSIGDKKNAEELINHSLLFFSLLLSFLSLIIFLWKVEITVLLFSNKYIDSSLPLFLFMISLMLRSLANILGYSIVSANYSKIPMKVNAVAMILGIFATWLFVNLWGYVGAVLATILLNLVSLLQYLYYFNKLNLNKINFNFMYPIVSLLLFFFTINYFIKTNLVVNIITVLLFISLNKNSILRIKQLFFSIKIKAANI